MQQQAIPVQIGTNVTRMHVAFFMASIFTCGAALPFWAVYGIYRLIVRNR